MKYNYLILFLFFFSIISSQNFIFARNDTENTIQDNLKLGTQFYRKGDIEKAIYYFSIAADQGDIKAQYLLGFTYTLENELEKAEYYYLLAAKQNHLESIYGLGIIYFQRTIMRKQNIILL